MPEPIIEPITIIVASTDPSPRRSEERSGESDFFIHVKLPKEASAEQI
jgi:hypothetical protein